VGLHQRQNVPYTSGINSLTLAVQFAEQHGQLEKVLGSQVRPPGRQDQERIFSAYVSPRRRQRPYPSLARLSKEDSVLAPGMGEANQLVFVTAQWMERVRYTDSLRILATTGS
jgi:hypothetical protein